MHKKDSSTYGSTEMSVKTIRTSCYLVFFFLCPVPAWSQSTLALEAYSEHREAVRELPYGAESFAGTTALSKTDLDSALKILLQGGGLDDILAEELAEISYTIKSNRYGTWKLVGVGDSNPGLYPLLDSALVEAQQEMLREQLSGEIDSFDSYKVGIVLSPEDREDVGQMARYIREAIAVGLTAENYRNARSDGDSEDQEDFEVVEASPKGLGAHYFGLSTKIIDNRGRMTFSALQNLRSGVVGPDETTITFGYEKGLDDSEESLRSALAARKTCIRNLGDRGGEKESMACANLLVEALNSIQSEEIEKQERVSVSIKYKDIDSFEYVDPASMFEARFPGTHSFTFAATYGRNLDLGILDTKPGQLAVSASFEDVKDNSELNDRGLLQATYTLNFEGFEVPISLTWSNKSELVRDSDANIGGHIGIQVRTQ